MNHEFVLQTEYIELIRLIKLLGLARTGGQAKIMVEQGKILLNGNTEFRKRAKIRCGDELQLSGEIIKIRCEE